MIMQLFHVLLTLHAAYSQVVQIPIYERPDTKFNIPSEEEGAKIARTLVSRESLMNVNSIDSKMSPVSFMEYYADCDNDGDPYWLIVEIGSSFQNILNGSAYSFSIRAGDHWPSENVNMSYPGGMPLSPAGSPRVNLKGDLKYIDMEDPAEIAKIESCFTQTHPDSRWWLPSKGSSPHKSRWAKIHVYDVYFVGGFGDRAYIGNINRDIYHRAAP